MIKKRIALLVLAVGLAFPLLTHAQTAAANKSWNAFWTQFSSAVNRKNKAAVKGLMASESEFSSGGDGESRDEWLALADERNWWSILQKSVRIGTKSYNYDGKPGRVTRNNHLVFAFTGGKWRFIGPMGD